MIDLGAYQDYLFAALFSMVRIGACFIIAPFFSQTVVPGLVRNGMILSMTMVVIPATLASMPAETLDAMTFIAVLIKEALLGFIIGFIMGIAFHIAENVGAFIDTQRGSSMGQMFDPMSGGQVTTLGALFTKIIVVVFFVGGGFLAFMTFLYGSYGVWPVFEFFPDLNSDYSIYALQLMDHLMRMIFLIAAPVAIVLFLSEFGLGLMNRFAPQLNVFSLSMPIKSGVAMFMFIIYMTVLFDLFNIQLEKTLVALKLFRNIVS